MYHLIDQRTGATIQMNSLRKTFRGEVVTVLSFTPPKVRGSTGRVRCREVGGAIVEWYPSIIEAKIIEGSTDV